MDESHELASGGFDLRRSRNAVYAGIFGSAASVFGKLITYFDASNWDESWTPASVRTNYSRLLLQPNETTNCSTHFVPTVADDAVVISNCVYGRHGGKQYAGVDEFREGDAREERANCGYRGVSGHQLLFIRKRPLCAPDRLIKWF